MHKRLFTIGFFLLIFSFCAIQHGTDHSGF